MKIRVATTILSFILLLSVAFSVVTVSVETYPADTNVKNWSNAGVLTTPAQNLIFPQGETGANSVQAGGEEKYLGEFIPTVPDGAPDLSKPSFTPADSSKSMVVDKKESSFRVPGTYDANLVGAEGDVSIMSDNSCNTSSGTDIQSNVYTEYIESSGDVDWYKGVVSTSKTISVTVIPPYSKDYDFEIWSSCSTKLKTCSSAGVGAIESCTATVSGNYYVKVYGFNTAYTSSAPYVITGGSYGNCSISKSAGSLSKSSYGCNDTIAVNSTKLTNNESTYVLQYYVHNELYDPSKNFVSRSTSNMSALSPGYYTYWDATHTAPTGGWTVNGSYYQRYDFLGWCIGSGGGTASGSIVVNPNVNCTKTCSISGADGNPEYSSYESTDSIKTINHKFTNNGNMTYNYTYYSQLKDPSGNVVNSFSNAGNSIDPGYSSTWYSLYGNPSYGWGTSGGFTSKTWVSGTCTDGTSKTAYSYAYPTVNASCKLVSDSAWVQQDNSCTNSIITQHKFINNGTRVLPYTINFYLYGPDGAKINQTTNAKSLDPAYATTWTVTWGVPSGGWKSGTYKSEAVLSGSCTGGGSVSSSNYANPVAPSSCSSSSCDGTIGVNVKDNYSAAIVGAKVYLDSSFRGYTDSSGNASLSVSNPTCGKNYGVSVYCANGTFCATKSTTTDYTGDSDQLNFSCEVCAPTRTLSVSLSGKSNYALNESVSIGVTVKDPAGNNTDASLLIYDPFLQGFVVRSTTGGQYTYTTTASRSGAKAFTITASKSGFYSVSATKIVTVNQSLSSVVVDVKNNSSVAINGANVYLDGLFDGVTSTNGRRTLYLTSGAHSITVKCPELTLCGTKNINVSGTRTEYFTCSCDIDDDGDGLSTSQERIFGTDPYKKDSNADSFMRAAEDCMTLSLLTFGVLNESQKQTLINNMQGMDYNQLTQLVAGGSTALASATQNTTISTASVTPSTSGLKTLYEKNKDVNGYLARDRTVIIVATTNDGNVSIAAIGPGCEGKFIGIVGGALGGLADDAQFLWAVMKGMYWAAFHIKDAVKATGDLMTFIFSGEFIKMFNDVSGILKGIVMNILGISTKWNYYTPGTNEYMRFQSGFVSGYVVGYVAEQFLLGKGIGEAIKSVKIIKQGAEIIDIALEAFERISKAFGSSIAEVLKGFKTEIFKWTSESAQNFAARTVKIFSNTADIDNWIYNMGSKAESVMAKGDNVFTRATAEMGETSANRAMGKLLATDYGKKIMEQWSEDAVYGALKASDAGLMTTLERISTSYGDDVAQISAKAIQRKAIGTDSVLMQKFAEYTKGARNTFNNPTMDPLELADVHQVKMIMRADGMSVKFLKGTKSAEVKDVIVIKKGDDTWGWIHMGTRDHFNQIKNVLNLPDSEASVLAVIQDVIQNGNKVVYTGDKVEITKLVTGNGKTSNILVVISDRTWIVDGEKVTSVGSFQTAYPI